MIQGVLQLILDSFWCSRDLLQNYICFSLSELWTLGIKLQNITDHLVHFIWHSGCLLLSGILNIFNHGIWNSQKKWTRTKLSPLLLISCVYYQHRFLTLDCHATACNHGEQQSDLIWASLVNSQYCTEPCHPLCLTQRKWCRSIVTGHTATKVDLFDLKMMPVRHPRQEHHQHHSWQNSLPEWFLSHTAPS